MKTIFTTDSADGRTNRLESNFLSFLEAKPIWPKGREREMNLTVAFRTLFKAPIAGKPILRIAASNIYRAWLNGQFLGHGPACGPHGFYRVDEFELAPNLVKGINLLAIEVAVYNINSYYLLDQAGFLQAEVVCDGNVLAATGKRNCDFIASVLNQRIQKVSRYSIQRTFTEAYHLKNGYDEWRKNIRARFNPVLCAIQPKKKLLPRHVAHADYRLRPALRLVASGKVVPSPEAKVRHDLFVSSISNHMLGFKKDELEINPAHELQLLANSKLQPVNRFVSRDEKLTLGHNSFHVVDFGTNLTGFIGATVTCPKKTCIFILFDEILSNNDVDFTRMSCVNVISYELLPGRYELETIEPYTLRYAKLLVLNGQANVESIHLREYANSDVWGGRFAAGDERLNRLFAAGRETFRQNAVDVFMDCPSRERAGWLCDSFFTARVATRLGGDTRIEDNFLENYLLPKHFEHLPKGMLPMCYPSDHYNGRFIPNWAMWFVIELEEYLTRSGNRTLVNALRPKVLALIDYFKQFLNADGLLEKLENWVFVEWSDANKYVQDVNYPSNMLYAGMLSAAGRIYKLSRLLKQAEQMRKAIRRQSFDGSFFVDNAVRKDGRLEITRNRTETCQYYAFFFDVATPGRHPELWKVVTDQFGPKRQQTKSLPEIAPANSFIGNMLRAEILSRYGRQQQILDESVAYLLYMAEKTGTLWENIGETASCNHGFASHIVHTLYRDILGLYHVDPARKSLELRFGKLALQWCQGAVPTPDGPISLHWRQEPERIAYTLNLPAGWKVATTNLSGKAIVRQ